MNQPFRAFESASTQSSLCVTQSYIRDSLRLDRDVASVIQSVEDILDIIQTSEEESLLAQELIESIPHPRALLLLSSFMSINHYPLFPETVDLVLNALTSNSFNRCKLGIEKEEDHILFNEEITQCISWQDALSVIRVRPFGGEDLFLERSPKARNTYFRKDEETDREPSRSIIVGRFGRSSIFEPIKSDFIEFPSCSGYSITCSEAYYRYYANESNDLPPRSLFILNTTERTGRKILGHDIHE